MDADKSFEQLAEYQREIGRLIRKNWSESVEFGAVVPPPRTEDPIEFAHMRQIHEWMTRVVKPETERLYSMLLHIQSDLAEMKRDLEKITRAGGF